ncbi:stage VI sporulation protein F [Litchfieldia alkalitelluris]|uniref:stage VI sporulation protein F n=1 Tax=Litchfieldia alkalitelluris TaxID=304268 RepID=UPI0038B264D8
MSDFSKGIEKKTGVRMDDVMKLANSLQNSNLQDEKTVRKLVKRVSKLAGKNVPKSKEDMIVDLLVKKKKKIDPATISKMIGK